MSLSCPRKRPRARFFLLGAFGKSVGSKEASPSSSLSPSPELTVEVKLECEDVSSERPTGTPPSTGGSAWGVIEVEVGEEPGWSTNMSSASVDDEEESNEVTLELQWPV